MQDDSSRRAFHTISAYIRLGHKYQINTLFDESLSYLKECFTIDLKARQAWLDHRVQVPLEWGSYRPEIYAIGVVNLARLAHCDTILPTALAACCSLRVESLFDGFVREDGTRERLSEGDLRLCMTGMRGLTHAASAVVIKALAASESSRRACKTKEACRRATQDLLNDVAQAEPDSSSIYSTENPFRESREWFNECWQEEKACAHCLVEVKKRFRTEQRNMWAALPSIFGITVKGWPQRIEQ